MRAIGTARSGWAKLPGAAALASLLALALAACSAAAANDASAAATTIGYPAIETPSQSAPAEVDTSTIHTLIESPSETPVFTVTGEAQAIAGETAQAVEYTSGGKTITGVMRTPAGDGPLPAVVYVHGAVDPAEYESGRDMVSTQRALLDAGYVVFATDLRGYAGSDPAATEGVITVDPGFGWSTVLDWGMALDVVNALRILRNGDVEQVDPERIGLLGHSLGGLLSIDAAVIDPGLSELVVALSAPSTDISEHFEAGGDVTFPGLDDFYAEVGTPEENPQYWHDISPRYYFALATEPLVLFHGGADTTTLPQWSVETADAWQMAGHDAYVQIIDGAGHHFEPHDDEVNGYVVSAFDAVLGQGG